MRSTVATLLPPRLRRLAKRAVHLGWKAYCPVCSTWLRGFVDHPQSRRPNAMCPVCRSLERHRFAWLVLDTLWPRYTADHGAVRLLHVAPEAFLEGRFRADPRVAYLSGDLHNPRAMVRLDITRIPCSDGTFHVVFCCHVLEHVADDRAAISELHRVVAVGGTVLIMVPLRPGATIETAADATPDERRALLGHAGHVRLYGPDLADRLRAAGFRVVHMTERDLVEPDRVRLLSVAGQSVFAATRSG